MGSAQAHAQLVLSNPASGATLLAAPPRVVLTFDDPLIALGGKHTNEIIVKDSRGVQIDAGDSVSKGTSVSVGIRAPAATGTITVIWRVVADDGHPSEGSFTFSVVTPTATVKQTDAPITKATGTIGSGKREAVTVLLAFLAILSWTMVRRRKSRK
jgi:methionine-rich copper-binding protein CopC